MQDVQENIVEIHCDGQFVGTGFFRNQQECITCHHLIYDSDKIEIVYNGQKYSAEWLENESMLEYDLSVLRVDGIGIKPLVLAKQATPDVEVRIYGYTCATISTLVDGSDLKGTFSSIEIKYAKDEIKVAKSNPWNKKPKINATVYKINTTHIGLGLSGSPVWEPNRSCVVGMFIAQKEGSSTKDVSTTGFVVPTDVFLKNENFLVNIAKTDISQILEEGNYNYNIGNYTQAIDKYKEILLNRGYIETLNNLGKSFLKLKNYKEAQECFDIRARLIKNLDFKKRQEDE